MSPNISIWIFGVCSGIFFFKYNDIISTSQFPFHNPLVMKYYNFFSIFFISNMKIVLLLNSVDRYFAIILYPSNTDKLHRP